MHLADETEFRNDPSGARAIEVCSYSPGHMTKMAATLIYTAQKDTIIDIPSDSQVNSSFQYRWSPASLTFNNYFLPISVFIYIENNRKKQRATSKIPNEPKQQSRLGTASNEITGGGGGGEASTILR